MSRPVPLPRRQMSNPDKSEDGELLKCPPQSPTRSPKGGPAGSAPPPLPPKNWTVQKSPAGNGVLEIVKVTAEKSADDTCRARPPLLPQKPPKEEVRDSQCEDLDDSCLMDWWEDAIPWKSLCKDLKLRGEKETKIITVKAEHLYRALRVYILLLTEHGGFLKEQTAELLCIAGNLDKVSKGTTIAGITGGATTVAGGVAAAAGVILSPLTMGASLALTVVGVGVATAGGVTGASAAIANKVNVTQDKKKIEKTFQEYERVMVEIQDCLKFINEGMDQLKQHDLSVLSEARRSSLAAARVVQLATTGGGSAKAIEANSKASGLMQGFALGLDIHFTRGKDGQKLKKGHESKLAKKIRCLAEDLNTALDELMQVKELFSRHCDGEQMVFNRPALA